MIDVGEKGDVVDFIALWKDETPDAIRKIVLKVLEISEPVGPASELLILIENTISGKRLAAPWPHPSISRLSNALLPGTVTLIGGEPGSGKSLFVGECITFWQGKGFNPVAFML